MALYLYGQVSYQGASTAAWQGMARTDPEARWLYQGWAIRGWNDAAAVKGATTATLMCMSLGPPWIKQHSQSKMIEMAIIQQEWEEEFRNSWDTLTTRYLKTDQSICTSGTQKTNSTFHDRALSRSVY